MIGFQNNNPYKTYRSLNIYNVNKDTIFLIHIFIIFAFNVKLPISIVHFWLPKSQFQAPESDSIVLAGFFF